MTNKLSPAISLNEFVNIKPDLFGSHFLARSSVPSILRTYFGGKYRLFTCSERRTAELSILRFS